MHRHLGCDIYLITQDARCLARELQELAEYNIKAVRRSHSIGNMFTYKFYSSEECFKTKRIKKDKKVFGMYRSMIVGEGEKIRSIPLKHILIFTTLIICAGVMFKFLFVPVLNGMNRKQTHATPTKKQKSKVVEGKNEVIKDDGYYKIIGIVDGLYVVKTPKGLKKVKLDVQNKKNINDEIKIEKL